MNNFQLPQKEIETILSILEKQDSVLAFPTDTVWGLGCLVEKDKAIDKIYEMKGRDRGKPLILLGSSLESLLPYTKNVHKTAITIMEKYFPGAVTLVLPKSVLTPYSVTSGFDTVGIRVPDYLPLQRLLETSVKTHVLATTSANLSGAGSTALKKDVESSLGDKIDYILDDYDFLPKGKASTVVGVDENGNIKIFRQGAVNIEI